MIRNAEGPEGRSARNGHARCVLCGGLKPRSLKLSFQDAGDAGVKTRFTASHELQGYDGILHGGIVAGLLDAAMTNSPGHCAGGPAVAALQRVLGKRVSPGAAGNRCRF